jgi:CRP-like cAMP-binding protein
MSHDLDRILAGCRLLRFVEGPSRDRLLEIGRLLRLRKGERVFSEGDACPGLFIVGDGLVRIYKVSPNGKEHVLHLAPPGQTFAEVAALGGFPCPANAEALAGTTCVLLPTDDLVAALAEDHELCLQVLQGMTGWVRHLVGLIEDITLRDAAGRVARHLLEAAGAEGDVRLPAAKRHLASHLNLTSETLSRTLRRLTEAGLVRTEEGTLRIVSEEGLRKVGEGIGPEV